MDIRILYKYLKYTSKIVVTFLTILLFTPRLFSLNVTAILNLTQTNPPPILIPYPWNNTSLNLTQTNSPPNLLAYPWNTTININISEKAPPIIIPYPWNTSWIANTSENPPPAIVPYPKKNAVVSRKTYGFVIQIENVTLTNTSVLALIGNYQFITQVYLDTNPPAYFNASNTTVDLIINGTVLPARWYYLNKTIPYSPNLRLPICVNTTFGIVYCQLVSLSAIADIYLYYPKTIPCGGLANVLVVVKPKTTLSDVLISLKSTCPSEIYSYKSNTEAKYIGYLTYVPEIVPGKIIYAYYHVIPTFRSEHCKFYVSLYQNRQFMFVANTSNYSTTGNVTILQHSMFRTPEIIDGSIILLVISFILALL